MSRTVQYRDLHGEVHKTTWSEVFDAARRIHDYFNAVNVRFVERRDTLNKIMFAMVMREHVLLMGDHGTAKSALVGTVFNNISGSTLWGMDFTRFTTETHLFGAYNTKEMEETGKLIHMTEGSVAEANFAKMGEFFDASDALLRTLLGVLNERRVSRGPQKMEIPLITGVADTNFTLDEMPHRGKKLAALVDRFLFHTSVEYVKDERNRMAMLDMALDHVEHEPLPPLAIEDIILVSGVIHAMNLVSDHYVKEAYQAMTFAYCQARVAQGREWVSDRRYIKAAQVMEANALLHNRRTVTFEDLKAADYVLVQHPDDVALLDEARRTMIETWVAKSQRRDIERELEALAQFTNKIPDASRLQGMKVSEVRRLQNEIDALHEEIDSFSADTIEARQAQNEALVSLLRTKTQTDLRLIDLLVESLPAAEGDPSTLKSRFDLAKEVYAALRQMRPAGEEAITKVHEALGIANERCSEMETAFTGRRI